MVEEEVEVEADLEEGEGIEEEGFPVEEETSVVLGAAHLTKEEENSRMKGEE